MNQELKKAVGEMGRAANRGMIWLEGVTTIGAGFALPVWAWSKRPLNLRDLTETALAALRDEWTLKPAFFYGSFVVAVALIVSGIGKLRSLERR